VLGYDPWRTTADGVERLEKAAKEAGSTARCRLKENPVDAVSGASGPRRR
jgi:hypothetical protein